MLREPRISREVLAKPVEEYQADWSRGELVPIENFLDSEDAARVADFLEGIPGPPTARGRSRCTRTIRASTRSRIRPRTGKRSTTLSSPRRQSARGTTSRRLAISGWLV